MLGDGFGGPQGSVQEELPTIARDIGLIIIIMQLNPMPTSGYDSNATTRSQLVKESVS